MLKQPLLDDTGTPVLNKHGDPVLTFEMDGTTWCSDSWNGLSPCSVPLRFHEEQACSTASVSWPLAEKSVAKESVATVTGVAVLLIAVAVVSGAFTLGRYLSEMRVLTMNIERFKPNRDRVLGFIAGAIIATILLCRIRWARTPTRTERRAMP